MIEDNEEIQTFAPVDPPEPPATDEPVIPEPARQPEKPSGNAVKPKLELSKIGFTPYLAGSIAIIIIFLLAVAIVKAQKGQEVTNLARERLAQGRAALVDGDLSRALYEFTVAIELDPNLPGAHSALGGIAIANGNGNDAVKNFNAELEINPDDRQSRLALGCIYTLGLVPPDDTLRVKPYLLRRFNDIIQFNWPADLKYDVPADLDPLTQAVYNFQFVLEQLPADPAPEIGLALSEVARNDLSAARDRLSQLMMDTTDDNTIRLMESLIDDINNEEQYQTRVAGLPPQTVAGIETTPPEPAASFGLSTNYSEDLGPLPPIMAPGGMPTTGLPMQEEPAGDFGSRNLPPLGAGDGTEDQSGLGLRITRDDLVPQPTVKPISNDVYLEEAKEYVNTVRLANIYQPGSVGFRAGETIVMPNTNTEVRVVEAGDSRIVLQEGQNTFVWVKGDVGWVQEVPETPETGTEAGSEGSATGESSENGNEATSGNLGPDVSE
jgi:hypothetical protein